MFYTETKVYFDGSHYIGIPHTTRSVRKKIKPPEETMEIVEKEEDVFEETADTPSLISTNKKNDNNQNIEKISKKLQKNTKNTVKMTKKEYFEQLYTEFIDLSKKERMSKIIEKMLPYFEKQEYCKSYVKINFERKERNIIVRKVRMVRKAKNKK